MTGYLSATEEQSLGRVVARLILSLPGKPNSDDLDLGAVANAFGLVEAKGVDELIQLIDQQFTTPGRRKFPLTKPLVHVLTEDIPVVDNPPIRNSESGAEVEESNADDKQQESEETSKSYARAAGVLFRYLVLADNFPTEIHRTLVKSKYTSGERTGNPCDHHPDDELLDKTGIRFHPRLRSMMIYAVCQLVEDPPPALSKVFETYATKNLEKSLVRRLTRHWKRVLLGHVPGELKADREGEPQTPPPNDTAYRGLQTTLFSALESLDFETQPSRLSIISVCFWYFSNRAKGLQRLFILCKSAVLRNQQLKNASAEVSRHPNDAKTQSYLDSISDDIDILKKRSTHYLKEGMQDLARLLNEVGQILSSAVQFFRPIESTSNEPRSIESCEELQHPNFTMLRSRAEDRWYMTAFPGGLDVDQLQIVLEFWGIPVPGDPEDVEQRLRIYLRQFELGKTGQKLRLMLKLPAVPG